MDTKLSHQHVKDSAVTIIQNCYIHPTLAVRSPQLLSAAAVISVVRYIFSTFFIFQLYLSFWQQISFKLSVKAGLKRKKISVCMCTLYRRLGVFCLHMVLLPCAKRPEFIFIFLLNFFIAQLSINKYITILKTNISMLGIVLHRRHC